MSKLVLSLLALLWLTDPVSAACCVCGGSSCNPASCVDDTKLKASECVSVCRAQGFDCEPTSFMKEKTCQSGCGTRKPVPQAKKRVK